MWCKKCKRETIYENCEICNEITENDIPVLVYWCESCKTPLIKLENEDKNCTLCNSPTKYLASDIRPVFPEERLLFEILTSQPLEYKNRSVWASNNRYYIDGNVKTLSSKNYKKFEPDVVINLLEKYKMQNDYNVFNENIDKFIKANKNRLNSIILEAHDFIEETAKNYPPEYVVISFSGGKDSTAVADLTVKAMQNPSLVHIFGDTTLEFPLTLEYANRFRKYNPKAIFKTARNNDQDFHKMCEDIGPPARMLRWCCSTFKTGPITRVLNSLYRDTKMLSFYGVRKCESVSRSKYNRVEDSADAIKINKQKVASPIFYWKDIDVWLYILGENVDFNDAYRLGFDRVGCWCCPNNNERAQFLATIYMSEQAHIWREFLIDFAKKIGKPDYENYVDSGKWKARQGGNGVKSASDVKIKFANCTAEENAKVYKLNKPVDDMFMDLMLPFGKISEDLGRKLIKEKIILDIKTNVPILSIQPFEQEGFEYSVKIKTMNVVKHDDLQRKISYQIKKFNACRNCLKCESLCKFGAITIKNNIYKINADKCTRCKMCVTPKYLTGGCMMEKYLKTKE